MNLQRDAIPYYNFHVVVLNGFKLIGEKLDLTSRRMVIGWSSAGNRTIARDEGRTGSRRGLIGLPFLTCLQHV
jgi:hypothetical protein